MYIIKIIADEHNSRPPLQTWNKPNPPAGYALCPNEFVDVFYSTDPAGFVNIAVEHNIVRSMEVNQEALDAYIASNPVPEKTPAELREEAYNTERIIEWNGDMLTVTETAQLWLYYASEGSETAEELQRLIIDAKNKIREMYPDVTEGDNNK